jgi:nucleotide-binding universal stress UspA family protein
MSDFQNRPLRVLLPAKPTDDLSDAGRLLGALVPADRTHVRRFYVHRPVESNFFLPDTYARFRDISRLEFEAEIATRAGTEREMSFLTAAGFEVSSEVVRGAPADEVLREADLWRADLAVVRTRGAAAADHRVGSMASALLHHATCPVLAHLAVPARYRVKRILIPVDFSKASRVACDWGLAYAEITGAEPVLLHVVPDWKGHHGIDPSDLVEAARQEIERWRAGATAALTRHAREAHVILAETVADGIASFAKDGKHDLLVMSATGATAVRALLLGSNTRKLLRSSATPVLVTPSTCRVTVDDFLRRAHEAAPARLASEKRAAAAVAADA